MGSNLGAIRATYEGSSEDNGRALTAVLAPDAKWTEAAGVPYAGTCVGPEAIAPGVFQRLGTEWIDYQAAVHTGHSKAAGRLAASSCHSLRSEIPELRIASAASPIAV
jgi:ketosteroid isomerase-like protein